MPKPRPCIECETRPKALPRQRCTTCQLRHEPIGVQVEAALTRLAAVPVELRVKRGARVRYAFRTGKAALGPIVDSLAPAGQAWCAGCQSFRDHADFRKGATKCRPCSSAKAHEAMVGKVYGLALGDYAVLLEAQGGRCAICRNRPGRKRLAVDHDHRTGAVRGLLCGKCNHEALGNLHDSLAMVEATWHYLNTPPASGAWIIPSEQPPLMPEPVGGAVRPPDASSALPPLVSASAGIARPRGARGAPAPKATTPRFLPVGSVTVPGKRGVWRVWIDADDPEGDAPF